MNAQSLYCNKTIFTRAVSIMLFFATCSTAAQNLMMGTIQFPSSIATVPDIRVYRGGRKILCEQDQDSKKITLTIPREPREQMFYLLISESISFHQVDSDHPEEAQNTIGYFRVPKKQDYKLYKLQLVCEQPEQRNTMLQNYRLMLDADVTNRLGQKDKKKQQPMYSWRVTEQTLQEGTRSIPEDTIIVYYYPHLIESISGGSKFELPTIKIKSDLITLVGSELKLHELSDGLVLSCLDHDSLHATIQQNVRLGKLHTLVAPTA